MSPRLVEIEKFIALHRLLRPRQRVLVAFSGGLDSTVLLHVLRELSVKHHWRLAVGHFNHQLRGAESDADELWAARQADQLGLEFRSGCGNVRAYARQQKLSLEMAARRLRHEFLARTAQQLGSRTVALAHHAEDQVELFLLRLLRGAGPEGLAGMQPRSASPSDARILLIRPLLAQEKSALSAYARDHGLPFREDSSNAVLDRLRNRVRHELVPLLRRRYQPGLIKTVLRVMAILGAEADLVGAQAVEWLRVAERPRFEELPIAIQRGVVREQLLRLKVPATFDLVECLCSAAGRPVCIAADQTVLRDAEGLLHLEEVTSPAFDCAKTSLALAAASGRIHFGGLEIRWHKQPWAAAPGGRPPSHEREEWFDADKVGALVTLRHWRPGDRFQPIGLGTAAKLQDLFTNERIPRADRRRLVMATTAGGEIFWVERLRIAEQFKLDNATRYRLKWGWRRA